MASLSSLRAFSTAIEMLCSNSARCVLLALTVSSQTSWACLSAWAVTPSILSPIWALHSSFVLCALSKLCVNSSCERPTLATRSPISENFCSCACSAWVSRASTSSSMPLCLCTVSARTLWMSSRIASSEASCDSRVEASEFRRSVVDWSIAFTRPSSVSTSPFLANFSSASSRRWRVSARALLTSSWRLPCEASCKRCVSSMLPWRLWVDACSVEPTWPILSSRRSTLSFGA
mmetsp:Transcript_17175/g.34724  ORF Transcript_17175/g.34724 Transcript_17175/m.34724 type:complete len:233 (+) Transcript_17175:547-1245(+)